ncbi:MAG TPA: glycosyltransferase [Amycolatopsis sp.]|nr:glycosyltransferase [Amycolatopsis sp.]
MPAVQPLSIGMPVRNGARFLPAALDSLLEQTYGDFELFIADNCSTDETLEIVRDYAARDPRVRYHVHERDIGAAANFNYVFRATRAPLYKWAAGDDLQDKTFLARCVDVHAQESGIAAVSSMIEHIDEEGRSLGIEQDLTAVWSPDPVERFADYIRYDYSCAVNFGVQSRAHIARTRLLLPFWGSDRVFLAELALYGRTVVLDEPLFQEREHTGKLSTRVAKRDVKGFHRAGYGSRFLTWRHALELVRAIQRSDLTDDQRRRAFAALRSWAVEHRAKFGRSLLRGMAETATAPLAAR